ncbi:hypothetical protein FPQ18DRAFT_410381 [Pyronema domesticum]|nr:hypothetical protein FPQ18DRAFT_410381 [Pyronema domesticum]
MTAILRAAERICGRRYNRDRRVRIFTDSQSSVKRLSNLSRGPGQYLATAIHKTARAHIATGDSFSVESVPRHRDIPGNKPTSWPGKASAYNRRTHPPSASAHSADSYARNSWINGGHSGRISPRLERANHAGGPGDRSRIEYSCQIRVGHGHFKAFLHRFNLIDDPYCDCGEPNGPPQSVEHVLLRCLRFTTHRLDASEASPAPIETPLYFHTDKAVDKLVRLIRDTDMGTRRDRLRREAIRNGEEDGPGQFGEKRPEDGVNEKD